MSLHLKDTFGGFPFLDPRRNPYQPSPIEEDSNEESDVEMIVEGPSSDSELMGSDVESVAISKTQRAAQPAFQFLMPQGPVMPFSQIQRAAKPPLYSLVPQRPSVPLSSDVSVLPATDQPPAAARVLSNVEDKPVVLAFPVEAGFKYTKKFIDTLAGQFFYSYVCRKRMEVTVQDVNYEAQWAKVQDGRPEGVHWIALGRLKRAHYGEKYLLVKQNDGNYALGSYLQQGQKKTIRWVGSNETRPLSLEGDDNLARFIPVSEEILDTCFIRIENAYRAAIDSTQLIPAYQLNL